MNKFYSKDIFIHNIETLIKYGWEPEIEIVLRKKKIMIIAYEEFTEYIHEEGECVRVGKIIEALQLFDWDDVVTINCMGLDFSKSINQQSIVEDGKLWLIIP